MKKIPRVDTLYWIMVISANTIGESGGDLISQTFGLGYGASTVALIGLFFVAAMVAVLTRIQHATLYWIVIILSSTAGTTLSDYITRTLGLGYGRGTAVILGALAAIFVAWRTVSPRSSLETSMSRPAEFLYWLAILTSSTLGTAFGDFLSNGTALGFGGGTLVLMLTLVLIAAAAKLTRGPWELFYWLAIIVSHPMGATVGDYMTKGEGFDLGNLNATLILTAIFLAVVAYKVVSSRPRPEVALG
jgi:uncharacterized membrane-anchored protein